MICLSFDTDHMTPEAMQEFLHRYPLPGRATFFQHQHYEELESSDHEICPHPFITDLSHWETDIRNFTHGMKTMPLGVRFHSCVYSHMLGIGLNALGYRYSSNIDRLYERGLKPYRHPWGIWELPIYYMDCMDFWFTKNWPRFRDQPFDLKIIETALKNDGLYVFDIHPLHVALNTSGPEFYTGVKDRILQSGASPFSLRSGQRGAGDFFEQLLEAMEASRIRSHSCLEALQLLTE